MPLRPFVVKISAPSEFVPVAASSKPGARFPLGSSLGGQRWAECEMFRRLSCVENSALLTLLQLVPTVNIREQHAARRGLLLRAASTQGLAGRSPAAPATRRHPASPPSGPGGVMSPCRAEITRCLALLLGAPENDVAVSCVFRTEFLPDVSRVCVF